MSTPFFQVPLGYGTTFHGTQKFATQLQALNPIFATSLFNLPSLQLSNTLHILTLLTVNIFIPLFRHTSKFNFTCGGAEVCNEIDFFNISIKDLPLIFPRDYIHHKTQNPDFKILSKCTPICPLFYQNFNDRQLIHLLSRYSKQTNLQPIGRRTRKVELLLIYESRRLLIMEDDDDVRNYCCLMPCF